MGVGLGGHLKSQPPTGRDRNTRDTLGLPFLYDFGVLLAPFPRGHGAWERCGNEKKRGAGPRAKMGEGEWGPLATFKAAPLPVPADWAFSKGYSCVFFFFLPGWMKEQREGAGLGHIALCIKYNFIHIVPSRHLKKKHWVKLVANCWDAALCGASLCTGNGYKGEQKRSCPEPLGKKVSLLVN